MIPRLKPTLGFRELRAALQPGHPEDIGRFENAFAALMQQKHALAFPYGRTALLMMLRALGLKNSKIICPAYTCVVVPHAITLSGNAPVFIDCAPDSFNMDLDKAEAAITGETSALIATSIFGYPVDLDRLAAIRKRHPHIQILQDCAHSFSAEWHGRPVQKQGIAAFYGLNISKTLTSVFGGMVTTDDTDFYDELKTIRERYVQKPSWRKTFRRLAYLYASWITFFEPIYGFINRMERSGFLDRFVRYYDDSKIDMPADYLEGMCSLEARVGRANTRRYSHVIRNRREAARYYQNNLEDREEFKLPPLVEGATYSHYVIQVHDRRQWLEACLRKGLQLGWLIEYNVPEMPAYGSHAPEEFPISAHYARNSINLPVWGGEPLAQRVTEITKSIRKLLQDAGK